MGIIAAILLCCFLLCGCTGQNIEGQFNNTAADPSPALSIQQLTAEGDLDGDGIGDRAEITWEGSFACPFDVKVSFGTGHVQSITISHETVDFTARMYIHDVTGDGSAEIILPNIGGTDTCGTVSCMVISYDGESLVYENVFGEGFFSRDSSTYIVEMDDSYSFKLKSIPTGEEYNLPSLDLDGKNPGRDVFYNAYTVDGDIAMLDEGRKGIAFKSWLEYGVYDESGEKIIKGKPQYIHSVMVSEDGQWKVIQESIDMVHQEPTTYIPNPMQEKNSLEEINSFAGTDIQRPLAFELTNEKFFVINTDIPVADYRFSIDKNEYTFRASRSNEDISGVYGNISTLTRWYIDDVQYSLFSESDDDAELRQIAAEQAPVFYPVVEEIGDGFMTVLPNDETIERASADRITVPLQHLHSAKEPMLGDVVEISYNGVILESYPAQLGEVYSIRVMLPVG